jgi:cell division protein FtsA
MLNSLPNLIIGLDIGTSKVVVVVAERDETSVNAQIIGIGQAPSRGIRKGLIVNLEQAVESVQAAVADAEKMVGLPVESVTVAFGGGEVQSIHSKGMIALGRVPRQTTREDIERVIEAARTQVTVASNQSILHTIPVVYSIDGQSGIDDPLGMTGVRLEIELQSVIMPTAAVQNVATCIKKAGLQLEGFVIKPLASALGVLTSEETDAGSLMIDVGGGTTGIALYTDGKPKYLSVIPIGGDHITNDIACVLRIPLSKAEALKKEVSLDEDPASYADELEFDSRGKTYICTVKDVLDVVGCRFEELTEQYIKKEIKKAGIAMLPAGIALTGGVANTAGVENIFADALDLPVRLAFPTDNQKLPPGRNGMEYATATGIIRYVIEKEKNPMKYIDQDQEIHQEILLPKSGNTKKKPRKSPKQGSALNTLRDIMKELF